MASMMAKTASVESHHSGVKYMPNDARLQYAI